MCSRFSLTTPLEALRRLFQFQERPNLAARYNITPTSQVLAIRKQVSGAYEAFRPVWGLIPPFAKEAQGAARLINVRSETVTEKPSFREAYKNQRCLVPTDGFYEWKTDSNGQKQPYYFQAPDHQPLAFAGIWEVWQSPEGNQETSCSLLTKAAPAYMRGIHHRAPVLINPQQFSRWTDPDSKDPLSQLDMGPEDIISHPVGKVVGNVRAEGPDLIKPIRIGTPPQQGSLF